VAFGLSACPGAAAAPPRPTFHSAGTGVALHAKPTAQAQAKHRINHGDLTALLFLQGYSKANFVTPTGG